MFILHLFIISFSRRFLHFLQPETSYYFSVLPKQQPNLTERYLYIVQNLDFIRQNKLRISFDFEFKTAVLDNKYIDKLVF